MGGLEGGICHLPSYTPLKHHHHDHHHHHLTPPTPPPHTHKQKKKTPSPPHHHHHQMFRFLIDSLSGVSFHSSVASFVADVTKGGLMLLGAVYLLTTLNQVRVHA